MNLVTKIEELEKKVAELETSLQAQQNVKELTEKITNHLQTSLSECLR